MAFILGSVLFLALFIEFTMLDVNKRLDLYDIKGKLVTPQVEYKKDDSSTGHWRWKELTIILLFVHFFYYLLFYI